MELFQESVQGSLARGETAASSPTLGESEPYAEIPWWGHWISTAILSLTFVVGLPLNGATVLIFCRRKKLRHLVNFVLLLDCLSHIVLCLFCIPIHLVTVWSGSSQFSAFTSGNLPGLVTLQQVVANFVNLYSTFLTVSIAILRYRRLCWKKKDKFSTMNALKWSVTSGILAIAVIFIQSYAVMVPEGEKTIAVIYLVKISLILLAVATVFFCYIRVSQRVWANTANQEKTMDPAKLKKSRSVHLKATIHSCVQIVLVITTVTPHLYLEAVEMLALVSARGSSPWDAAAPIQGADEPLASASQQQQQLFRIHNNVIEEGDSEWLESAPIRLAHPEMSGELNVKEGDQAFEIFSSNNNNNGSRIGGGGGGEQERGLPIAAQLTTLGVSHLTRLIAITVNYALLALGTPCAYIASCHRFREQFTSILFSHVANSPQNSACHGHHHNHGHPNSSPGHKAHHHHHRGDRYHYTHQRSTTTQDACFSSPLTRADTRTSTTLLHNHSSSLMSRHNSAASHTGGLGARESVSISISGATHSRSSFSHSFKSRSSMRKSSVCGSSMKRRKSSSGGIGGGGGSSGSKGLLGVSIAADSVFMESDSALILEPDVSNVSSSTGNLKRCTPSPSPTGGDEVSGRGSEGELLRKSSSTHHLPHLTAVTTITTTNSSNLHTYLQSYTDCDCNSTDLGQLV